MFNTSDSDVQLPKSENGDSESGVIINLNFDIEGDFVLGGSGMSECFFSKFLAVPKTPVYK